jgi:hypothetical protein
MKETEAEIDIREKRDWSYGRNTRVLLRNAVAEFGASAFSVRLGDYWCPNRDYGHEGLCANEDGENWKYADAIAFCLLKEGHALELAPQKVVASPLKADYHYEFDGGSLVVSYYLLEKSSEPTLSVAFSVTGGRGLCLRLKPIADIRSMNADSAPLETAVTAEANGLRISRAGRSMAVRSLNTCAEPVATPQVIEWSYKLGSGERTQTANGTEFIGEKRQVVVAGMMECEFKRGAVEVLVSCDGAKKNAGWPGRKDDYKNEVAKYLLFKKQVRNLREAASQEWGAAKAMQLEARAYCLANKFAWKVGGKNALDAGAFWFRNAWLRDAAFALAADAKFFNLTEKRWATQLISEIFSQATDGVVPSMAGGNACVDATPLAALAAFGAGNEKLARTAGKMLTQFAQNSHEHGIFVCENGLLSCPPSYSWRDSRPWGQHAGLRVQVPTALPSEWVEPILSKARDAVHGQELLDAPVYLLDANALWAAAIEAAEAAGVAEGLPHPLDVLQSIKENFRSDGFLSHIASEEFGPAGIENSSCIQAMALLPHVFSEEDKKRALAVAEEKLFVKRQGKLFGLLSINSDERVFYGDGQYHGAVVWPRESYYLAKFLLEMGETKLAGELLEAQLEHQTQEGTMFYNAELFALPEGRNLFPEEETASDPVPVKNPAQMWSGWMAPYYDYLAVKD